MYLCFSLYKKEHKLTCIRQYYMTVGDIDTQ